MTTGKYSVFGGMRLKQSPKETDYTELPLWIFPHNQNNLRRIRADLTQKAKLYVFQCSYLWKSHCFSLILNAFSDPWSYVRLGATAVTHTHLWGHLSPRKLFLTVFTSFQTADRQIFPVKPGHCNTHSLSGTLSWLGSWLSLAKVERWEIWCHSHG